MSLYVSAVALNYCKGRKLFCICSFGTRKIKNSFIHHEEKVGNMPASTFGRVKKERGKTFRKTNCLKALSEIAKGLKRIAVSENWNAERISWIGVSKNSFGVLLQRNAKGISWRGCFEIHTKPFFCVFLGKIEFIILERRRVYHELFIT